jgi:hypothetical protein
MQFGKVQIPDKLKNKSFDWFKKYHKKVLKPNGITAEPDVIFKKLGGVVPEEKAHKAKRKPSK